MSPLWIEFPIEENRLECGVGVHLRFQYMTEEGPSPITNSAFFQRVVDGWLDASRHAPAIPVLESLHLDPAEMPVDWDTVLQDVVDVHTLVIADMPYIWDEPGHDRNGDLIAALTSVSPDGTMLLPGLRTILSQDLSFLLPNSSEIVRHRNVEPLVREMLRSRAAHGKPVTCMRIGSATCNPDEESEDERDREVNAYLRGLVAAYV
ncbi:hypothetical protein PENSPDRAFT_657671 [Peniophora sp. CONT]|nr:hypothetical protein PENSPDRAFT_657671 [Peniophora sp. CONT]